MIRIRAAALAAALVVSSGCAVREVIVKPLTDVQVRRVFERNYVLGKTREAFVGEAVVKVKDYFVDLIQDAPSMRPTADFVMTGGIITIKGRRDEEYRVRGQTKLDGQVFTVVASDREPSEGLLIDRDGSVYHRAIGAANGVLGTGSDVAFRYSFRTVPPELRFVRGDGVPREKVNIGKGYVNFELIYGGTDGKSINITYREYTSDDVARPAFYQALVYDRSSQTIRVRNIRIAIHEATNERLVHEVLGDGLE